MAFEKIGVEAVVDGMAGFRRDSAEFNARVAGMGKETVSAAKGSGLLGAAMGFLTGAGGPLALVASIGGTVAKALGNIGQIALGIITRDLLRGVVRGVGALFKDAADQIFGSADALKQLQKDAAKATADIPDLLQKIMLAKMRLSEMQADGKSSGVEIAEQIGRIQDLQAEVKTASATIARSAAEQRKWGESLPGQAEAFRSKLVDVAKEIIQRFLPSITVGFQRLAPVLVDLAQRFGAWIASPAMLTKAQQLIDWLTFTLPVALESARKAIAPILEILGGPGNWMDKLRAIGGLITDWVSGMVPVIIAKVKEWAGAFVAWIADVAPLWFATFDQQVIPKLSAWLLAQATWLSEQITTKWKPALTKWLEDASRDLPNKLGKWLGALVGWLATEGIRLFVPAMAALGKAILDLLFAEVSPESGNNMITGFLSGLWQGFVSSPVGQDIVMMSRKIWLSVLTKANEVWGQIRAAWANFWFDVESGLINASLQIKNTWNNFWVKVKNVAVDIWNKIIGVITEALLDLRVWIDQRMMNIAGVMFSVQTKIWWAARDLWNNVYDAITSPILKAYFWLQDKLEWIRGLITDPAKRAQFVQAAKDWVQGLIDGITQKQGSLFSAVTRLAQGAIAAALRAFGIGSPSKVGRAIGRNFGLSQAGGRERNGRGDARRSAGPDESGGRARGGAYGRRAEREQRQ